MLLQCYNAISHYTTISSQLLVMFTGILILETLPLFLAISLQDRNYCYSKIVVLFTPGTYLVIRPRPNFVISS